MKTKLTKVILLCAVSLWIAACGNNPTPVPLPPPAPTNPGGFVGGGGFIGGSCAAPPGAAAPLNPTQPYMASMPSSTGGQNTLSLQLFSYNQPPTAGLQIQNIVGVANLDFQDMQLFTGSAVVPTTLCASSASPAGGAVSVGSLRGNQEIYMTLRGIFQLPYVNPFTGLPGSFNGQPAYFSGGGIGTPGQEIFEIQIGAASGGGFGGGSCPAVLYQGNRLGDAAQGCPSVIVRLPMYGWQQAYFAQ